MSGPVKLARASPARSARRQRRLGARLVALFCACPLAAAAGGLPPGGIPPYAHIFVIVEENKGYELVIGPDTVAPNINRLAHEYGLATQFYAEVHPSEGNYVAMLGGDTYGIHDDDAFYCKPGIKDHWCPKSGGADYVDHSLKARSLVDQLEERGLTWKAYMESLPAPGSLAVRWPSADAPVAGLPQQLYAVKHNGFMNFVRVQTDPARAAKIVDFEALSHDLDSGQLPNYAHIVPNQCNDMHGRDAAPEVPPDCRKGELRALVARGDRVAGELVARIMRSAVWSARDNAAIVITFDENDKEERGSADQGCCGNEPGSAANSGGGRIPTVVITNHGLHGVVDDTRYNHYSLLRTTESAFGIGEYLRHAADTDRGVTVMTRLFAVGQ